MMYRVEQECSPPLPEFKLMVVEQEGSFVIHRAVGYFWKGEDAQKAAVAMNGVAALIKGCPTIHN